ncbi:MAG TPA: hypothetical protein VGG86_14050 [Roseiarcus sp.]|jgi:hypothetical protein
MSVDTCIPVRAYSSLNISRKRDETPHWATYRGANPRVRVLRIDPDRIGLQIRAGDHYAHAVLDKDELDALIEALTKARGELR